ncbi:MAG: hypothetical protein J1E64_08835 [Acetatifactor sp.]|nr:hypothetical protein [Acetatifactor sp.]
MKFLWDLLGFLVQNLCDAETIGGRRILFGFILLYLLWHLCRAVIKNKKRETDSYEKQRITEIIEEVSGGDDSLTVAFAHYRSDRGTLLCAIGFNKDRLYVVPLKFAEGSPYQIVYEDFMLIEQKQLSKIQVDNDKVMLYERDRDNLITLEMIVHVHIRVQGIKAAKIIISQRNIVKKWRKEFLPEWEQNVYDHSEDN